MTDLSEREQQIARQYADGRTYKQIARELSISPATVRNHLSAVYRKLEVGNKAQLNKELDLRCSQIGILPSAGKGALSEDLLRRLHAGPPGPPANPSIAVMPLVMIGPDDQDFIAQGLTADLQYQLTRCPDLLVAGRSSCLALDGRQLNPVDVAGELGVGHVLQGSLRASGNRLRLTLELVDGKTGKVDWSDSYDRSLDELLKLETDIAREVVGGLSLHLENHYLYLTDGMSHSVFGEYEWRLRGSHLLEQGGVENFNAAKDCFREALKINPASAPALAGLSMCYGYECDLLVAQDYRHSLQRHMEFAEKAVAADRRDGRGHYAMSCALMFDGQFERADEHAALGLELNPGEYHNICNRGYSLMALGQVEVSLDCFHQSLRRNPLAPNSCLLAVGVIEYAMGNYGQAARAVNQLTSYQVQRAGILSAACAQVGYDEQAGRARDMTFDLCSGLPLAPRSTTSTEWREFWQMAFPYFREERFDHLLDGLDKAGLPV